LRRNILNRLSIVAILGSIRSATSQSRVLVENLVATSSEIFGAHSTSTSAGNLVLNQLPALLPLPIGTAIFTDTTSDDLIPEFAAHNVHCPIFFKAFPRFRAFRARSLPELSDLLPCLFWGAKCRKPVNMGPLCEELFSLSSYPGCSHVTSRRHILSRLASRSQKIQICALHRPSRSNAVHETAEVELLSNSVRFPRTIFGFSPIWEYNSFSIHAYYMLTLAI
jgi:hypothetical protein